MTAFGLPASARTKRSPPFSALATRAEALHSPMARIKHTVLGAEIARIMSSSFGRSCGRPEIATLDGLDHGPAPAPRLLWFVARTWTRGLSLRVAWVKPVAP